MHVAQPLGGRGERGGGGLVYFIKKLMLRVVSMSFLGVSEIDDE